jgi:hypothetical protein
MASLAVGGGEAVDYYSDKLNAADVGSCFQVVKTKSKGKIIVATSDISKGVLIHRESPLVAMQSLDNKFDVVVCHYCKCNIGTLEQQIDLLQRKINRLDYLKYEQSWTLLGEEDIKRPPSHVVCSCGEIYCSSECQGNDNARNGHAILCTGPIDGESSREHPIIQFKLHAMETNEIFILAAQVVTSIIMRYKKDPKRSKEAFKRFVQNKWWDVVWPSNTAGDESEVLEEKNMLANTLYELSMESFHLLRQAILSNCSPVQISDKEFDELFNVDYYGSIIGMFEQNNLGIRRKSLVALGIEAKMADVNAPVPKGQGVAAGQSVESGLLGKLL